MKNIQARSLNFEEKAEYDTKAAKRTARSSELIQGPRYMPGLLSTTTTNGFTLFGSSPFLSALRIAAYLSSSYNFIL